MKKWLPSTVVLVVKGMNVYFLPKTALGKWSAGFIGVWLVFVLLAILFDEFIRNLAVANMLMDWAGISGILAFFTGIIGIIKSKDRSVIVFTATIIGFIALLLFASHM